MLSIGISGEGYLDKIGELKTQLDQLKISYSPKGVALNSSGMDLNRDSERIPRCLRRG